MLHWAMHVALSFPSCIEFPDTIRSRSTVAGIPYHWAEWKAKSGCSCIVTALDKTVRWPITVQLTLVSFRTCNNCSPSDSAPPSPLTSLLSIRCLCTSQYWLSWIKMLFTHCVFVSKPTVAAQWPPPSKRTSLTTILLFSAFLHYHPELVCLWPSQQWGSPR